MREWILAHTQARFGYAVGDPDGVVAASVVPQWFGEGTRSDALVAIRAWTATLFPDLEAQNRHIADGDLATLTVPVTVAFGEDDPSGPSGNSPSRQPGSASETRTEPVPQHARLGPS